MRFTIRESRSGLHAVARLLPERAPENAEFLWRYLAQTRAIPSLHAIYTGPEISLPIPSDHVPGALALPLENATCFPAPGDILLTYLPARVWGGLPTPVFDLGLFYAAGARTLLPIGWTPGSLCARIEHGLPQLETACAAIRRLGAVTLELVRDGEGA